ncbi:MAG: tetraacyldisaccharide 4'-kinase [Alphaproteobacteria bacterium]|nr:tetraacyldisaccharide 4'-kinase [Alphaproteobacteria bacterium]
MPIKMPKFWGCANSKKGKLLSPLGMLYAQAGKFRFNHTKPYKSKIPVICVGNVVVGGVGKTPLAVSIAEYYKLNNMKPVFLTRGYGGTLKKGVVDLQKHTAKDTGDEPLLLAMTAPVVVCADRKEGAKMAEDMGADIIIMDDGFQNPGLEKDLSFIVFDGRFGIGNGFVFPAGPLRETMESGTYRADAAIVVGEDKSGICNYFKENYSRMPIIRVHIEQDALTLQALSNKKIFAFAGIGYPDKFFNMLTEYGCNIVAAKAFPDHHPYTDTEMLDLISAASDMDAVLLTTAKDMVRIPSRYCSHVRMIKAYTVWDSVDLLCQILASFLKTDEKDKPVEKN